jgi:ABC-2 type transport system permease protein
MNEIYKIFVRKKIYIFIIILLIMAIFTGISTLHSNNLLGAEAQGQDQIISYVKDNAQNFPLIFLDGVSSFILPIFVIILISDMITDEYAEGTLKLTLLRQISRKKLLISKVLALTIILAVLFFFMVILGYIIGVTFLGLGDGFTFKEISLHPTMGMLFTLFIYLLSMFPLLAFAMIILIFAVLLSNSGEVIGIGVGLLFISMLVGQILNRLSPYLISNYFSLPKILYSGLELPSLLFGVLIAVAYGMVAFVVSLNIFRKRDMLI